MCGQIMSLCGTRVIKGCSFRKAINKTQYQPICDTVKPYEVFLYCQGYHWYLVLHCTEEGTNYPYITLEISTDGNGLLVRGMKVLYREGDTLTPKYNTAVQSDDNESDAEQNGDGGGVSGDDGGGNDSTIPLSKFTSKGKLRCTIKSLCKKADEVTNEMKQKGTN